MEERNQAPIPGLLIVFIIAGVFSIINDTIAAINVINLLPIWMNTFLIIIIILHIAIVIMAICKKYETRFVQLAYLITFFLFVLSTSIFLENFDIEQFGELAPFLIWTIYFFTSKKFKAYCGVSMPEGVETKETNSTPQAAVASGSTASFSQSAPQAPIAKTITPQSAATSAPAAPTYTYTPSKAAPRYCKYCGTQYNETDTNCPNCKKRVRMFVKPSKNAVKTAVIYGSVLLNLILITAILVIVVAQKPTATASQQEAIQQQAQSSTEAQHKIYDTSIVYILASGKGSLFHSNADCPSIGGQEIRRVLRQDVPNLAPCPVCCP